VKPKKYPIEQLELDARLQARDALDQSAVADYAQAYKAGTDMPPIEVYDVGGALYVVDGWHRIAGAREAGITFLRATTVGTGTFEQAAWHAVAANGAHGLRRTNADKRRAVRLALESPIGGEQSSRAIAEHVGVGDKLVSEVRAQWEAERRAKATKPSPDQVAKASPDEVRETAPRQVRETAPARRVGRDGKSYPVRAPKERVELDELGEAHSKSSTSFEAYGHLPPYGPTLLTIAKSIARVRLETGRADLPTSIAQSLERALRDAEGVAVYAVPEVCPRCAGARCIYCGERGWVERSHAEQLRATSKRLEGRA
jgi:transposase-like protein